VFDDTIESNLRSFLFLPKFLFLNELIWQEAFLIDFAQKKIINKWTQKFLIVSSYLFNERLVFDFITRFGIDFILDPLRKLSVIETTNIVSLLNWFIFFILFFVFSTTLLALYTLFF